MSAEIYAATLRARMAEERRAREERRREVLQRVEAAIPTVCARLPAVRRAFLYGSLVEPGRYHQKSDVDVALEADELSGEDYFALWAQLEAALPDCLIDLRDYVPDSHFGRNIKRQGKVAYERTDSSAPG